MTQHDPTAHYRATPRRPPADLPDPNSLPTDWSPSGTAHAGSGYPDTGYGVPSNAPVSAFTPGAPTGFTSVDSTGYQAVVAPRSYPGEPGGAPVAWLHAPTEPGDAPASRDRYRDTGRGADFDPASSWNGNTTMSTGRTTSDRDRNPWAVTPVPDRIPAEWDDTAVPDAVPQAWDPEPPTVNWNTPSVRPEAATEQWGAPRHAERAEPPASWNAPVAGWTPAGQQVVEGAWQTAPDRTRDSRMDPGGPGHAWNGDSRAENRETLLPRTENRSSADQQPEPDAAPRRGPRMTLVAAMIAAALAGGGVGAGIMAYVGSDSAATAPAAPPAGQAPDAQPTQGT